MNIDSENYREATENKNMWPKICAKKGYPRGPYIKRYKGEYKCSFCKYRHSEDLICSGVHIFLMFLMERWHWPSVLFKTTKIMDNESFIEEY